MHTEEPRSELACLWLNLSKKNKMMNMEKCWQLINLSDKQSGANLTIPSSVYFWKLK